MLTFIDICLFIDIADYRFLLTDILYMCIYVTVTSLRFVNDGNKEATYLLTYLLYGSNISERKFLRHFEFQYKS